MTLIRADMHEISARVYIAASLVCLAIYNPEVQSAAFFLLMAFAGVHAFLCFWKRRSSDSEARDDQ